MLPLRAVVESMGGTVGYDATTRMITMTFGSVTMTHQIGTSSAVVNGVSQPLAIASYAANGRTFIHLRAIELLNPDIAVDWNAADRDRVEITFPQGMDAPDTIEPDGSADVPVIVWREEDMPDEPMDMELHLCNMVGEDFVIESLMIGESGTSSMYSLRIDDLYYGKPGILSVQLKPGLYNLSGWANGVTFDWKEIRLISSEAYVNLYTDGKYDLSDDPDRLGRPESEVGIGESTEDVDFDRTVQVVLRNKTMSTIESLTVYRSPGAMSDPVFETDQRISNGGRLDFELDYSEDAPYFTMVARQKRINEYMYSPTVSYSVVVYSGMELRGDTVIATLRADGSFEIERYDADSEV